MGLLKTAFTLISLAWHVSRAYRLGQPRMSTPQRIEKPVRSNLSKRLGAAEAKIVEEPILHGQKLKGWWLITPVGIFKLRGRGGSDTNAAALEMLDLL